MGARLISICDSFQAMLSDRPYRAALTLDEARAEIRRGVGVQFDPALARLFLDRCLSSGATVASPPATETPARRSRRRPDPRETPGADADPIVLRPDAAPAPWSRLATPPRAL